MLLGVTLVKLVMKSDWISRFFYVDRYHASVYLCMNKIYISTFKYEMDFTFLNVRKYTCSWLDTNLFVGWQN